MSAVTCHSLPVLIRYWCGRARPPARAKAGVYFCTRGDPSKLGSRLRGGQDNFLLCSIADSTSSLDDHFQRLGVRRVLKRLIGLKNVVQLEMVRDQLRRVELFRLNGFEQHRC